jgi:phage shock protein E
MKLLRTVVTILLLVAVIGVVPVLAVEPAAMPLLIDVRTPVEWQEGHLQGAVLIPYEKIGEEIAKVAPDKQTKINLYCRSGRRSGIALETLQKLGYGNVINNGGVGEASEKLKIPVVK